MNKLKMSIAALALVLTVGATFATNAKTKAAPNDCSLTPNQPTGTLNSANCAAPREIFCCYLINTSTQVLKAS